MISPPAGVRIWLAAGATDMRRGFDGLASLVAQQLNHDPFSGQIFAFRGRKGHLIKLLFWDGQGLVLYANYVASHCISFRCRLASWSGIWERATALSARRSHRLECFTGRFFSGSS